MTRLLPLILYCIANAVGCDITRVASPAIVQPNDLQNPAGAAALRAGALRTLFNGFSNQAMATGTFADEFTVSSPSVAGLFPEDQRVLTVTSAGNFPFTMLSQGRIDALTALPAVEQFTPTPKWHSGELYALIAATEIMFDENLCSGVSLAIVDGFSPSYGPTLNGGQILRQALVDLDSAASYAIGNDSIIDLVAILRGRALVDSGDMASAARAVQNVATSYAYSVPFDSVTPNVLYYKIVVQNFLTVADSKGNNGQQFLSANDPRVTTVSVQSGSSLLQVPTSAAMASSSMTLASGVEARLIGAEAALAAGDITNWTSDLNMLRNQGISPAMTPLPADSTANASVSERLLVMFRERAFWLFATGHRHGDLRRLIRQYGLPASTVFPSGLYEGGPQTFGTSVVYPVSGDQFNPNYHGCLNLDA